MGPSKVVERIAKHEEIKKEELVVESLISYLYNRKREFLKERFEIFSRYNISKTVDLKNQIKAGKISEHPSWEDFIEAKNIDSEIKSIENDIKYLQTS